MLKKCMAALLFSMMLTGALVASDWFGTYTGNDAGDIKGSLSEAVDPPVYNGSWCSYADYLHNSGTWYGVAWDVVDDCYFVKEGDIYDDVGKLVGHWSGFFPINNDALAYGKWWKFNGWDGSWTMERK
ncbi:hypothetical protein GX441_03175 [bacterium]|nr:hypothetical protein [bacterium]